MPDPGDRKKRVQLFAFAGAAMAKPETHTTVGRRARHADEIEILLVEDNPSDVELTLHAFRQADLANPIQVANDGEEALDYLFARGAYRGRALERSLKLVLLDLKLPKVDGLEVLRAIKGDSRLKVTPVVVLTSSLQERDLVESYHLGVNSYIQKPVNFDKFQEIVKGLSLYWLVVNQAPPARAASESEAER